MADWLKQAALRNPARRWAFVLAALLVAAAHLWVSLAFDDLREGWGEAAAMPERLQVSYVRELALADPPPAPAAAARVAAAPRPAPLPGAAASAAGHQGDKPPVKAPQARPDPQPEPVAPETLVKAQEPALPVQPPIPVETPVAASAPASNVAAGPAPAASAASNGPAFEWPASTRLSYVLTGQYRGEVNGNAQVEWIRQGSRYQVNLDVLIGPSFAPLIARRMTSDGELSDTGLRPLRYDEDTKVLFRERRRVSVLFQGPEVVLGNGRREPKEAGVQDAASQFVQLTWLFLTQRERMEPGRMIDMPLALPRKLYRWRYEILGEEVLQTPMGPLQTWHLSPKIEASGGDLAAEVWIAPRLQYLPVRIRIHQDPQTFIDLMLKAAPQQGAVSP